MVGEGSKPHQTIWPTYSGSLEGIIEKISRVWTFVLKSVRQTARAWDFAELSSCDKGEPVILLSQVFGWRQFAC